MKPGTNSFPWLVLLLIALGLYGYTARGEATNGFAVAGSLKCTFYQANGEVFTNQILPFEMEVSGERWRLVNHEGPSNRWVRGSDGSSVYHVFHDASNSYRQEGAIVEPGPMPSGAYPAALPWLAFASAGQLERKMGLFAPWADPYSEASVHSYLFRTILFDEAPRLPKSIDFVVDEGMIAAFSGGRYLAREQVSATERSARIARVAMEPPGFIAGRYEVSDATNLNGMLIPTKFRLTKFRVQPPDRGNYPVAAVYEGNIEHAHPMVLLEPLPDISTKPVSVLDLRFRDERLPIDSIRYSLTNRWITDTNAPFLIAIKQAKITNTPLLSKHDGRRLWIIGVIALLALASAVGAILATKTDKQLNPEQKAALRRYRWSTVVIAISLGAFAIAGIASFSSPPRSNSDLWFALSVSGTLLYLHQLSAKRLKKVLHGDTGS